MDLRTFSSPHCESKIKGKINIFIIYNPVIAHFIVNVMHHVPVFDENNHSQFNNPVLASARSTCQVFIFSILIILENAKRAKYVS